jgi:hypothetical protein
MPRTAGTFSLVPSYKATSGQTIRTEQHNPPLEDIAQALTDSVPRDGSAPMTGNLPMNGQRITGLGNGTAASDAVRRDQVTLYSAWLSALAGLSFEANKLPYATGAGAAALTNFTEFGRSLLDDADAATARGTLGLKSGATAELASKSEAEDGSDNAKYMTPLRTRQAIDERVPLVQGEVGTYAMARHTVLNTSVFFGETVPGSQLIPTSANSGGGGVVGLPLSGTWKCMGRKGEGTDDETNTTLWLRIS